MTVNGRVAVVTGGTKGNGKGIAYELAKGGAKVSIFARDSDNSLESLVKKMNDEGYEVIGHTVDIRDREQIKRAVEATLETYGKIDILVNNAGVMSCMPFLKADEENIDFHIDINIKGTWNVTQCVLPEMLKKKYGRIITISSVTGGFVSDGEDTAYAISKAALIGFGKSIAMEYVKEGITSNIVCPGYIRTPMVEKYALEEMPEDPEKFINLLGEGIPVGRIGEPVEVGNLVTYLAGDEAGFITGATIVIDGGCILPETACLT